MLETHQEVSEFHYRSIQIHCIINSPGIYLRNQDPLIVALSLQQQKSVQVVFLLLYFYSDHNSMIILPS